jgi:protein TonB
MRRVSALAAAVVMMAVAGGAAQQSKPVVDPKVQATKPGQVAAPAPVRPTLVSPAEVQLPAEIAQAGRGARGWVDFDVAMSGATSNWKVTMFGAPATGQAAWPPAVVDEVKRAASGVAFAPLARATSFGIGFTIRAESGVLQWVSRLSSDLKPPTKTKDVKPVYPAEARAAGVQGVVIIEALIDEQGKVTAARILRSVPGLDEAALDAVKGWVFTPTLKNGAPVPVNMTVTTRFALDQKPAAVGGVVGSGPVGGIAGGAERAGGAKTPPPTKLVDVKPVYPEAAKQAGIQGTVILELSIGKDGKVTSAKVLRSIPELDQAAIDAATKWEFTPTVKDGAAVPVVLAVTVNFKLQ